MYKNNYLGHEFIIFPLYHQCKKCSVHVWFSGHYYWLLNDKNEIVGEVFELTCEEYIIKGIIE